MPSYPPVRAVTRALMLLQELNRRPVMTVHQIYEVTGLPKPTIVRLLETLVDAGFVSNDPHHGGYQVTSLVSSLSAGFHGDVIAVEAARAWAVQLTQRFLWPVGVAVLDRDAVKVRFSTVAESPISPFHATINMRLSLVSRALGRAYLAFCPGAERELLIDILAQSDDPEDAPARNPRQLSMMIRTVRQQGFAERDTTVHPQSSGTIAVPIFWKQRVLATICMTFFRSAVPRAKAIEIFLEPLQSAARGIEESIRMLHAASNIDDSGSEA
ncbi:DNA-binding transcriptional regulator [Shumkonia mesophila]|uniref:DNA-binding transcriptional regulator n=1 Tax=Shumkonia mesophila TaxID=2838854 RepID=UPI002934FE64|nr:DNA-binding transcriptional regulator [Shumkonia mesophila]